MTDDKNKKDIASTSRNEDAPKDERAGERKWTTASGGQPSFVKAYADRAQAVSQAKSQLDRIKASTKRSADDSPNSGHER